MRFIQRVYWARVGLLIMTCVATWSCGRSWEQEQEIAKLREHVSQVESDRDAMRSETLKLGELVLSNSYDECLDMYCHYSRDSDVEAIEDPHLRAFWRNLGREQSDAVNVESDESGATRVGLWAVPHEQVDSVNVNAMAEGVIYMGPMPFRYDGETVTMHLFTFKGWMWRSKDEIYRMRSKWEGDDLYYLPPFADWQKLATWRRERFVSQEEVSWRFARVDEADAGKELAPLLAERELHDYTITPTGRRYR